MSIIDNIRINQDFGKNPKVSTIKDYISILREIRKKYPYLENVNDPHLLELYNKGAFPI